MTIVGRDRTAAVPATAADTDWVYLLSVPGPERDAALRRLHELLLRAARRQVWLMRGQLLAATEPLDDLANRAADDALVDILHKLATFAGRSRFTTWAYKFAVLHAAVEVRRAAWRRRDVPLTEMTEAAQGPDDVAEAADFLAAVRAAMDSALTAHQRRVMIALVVDEVPVDVLADRLATNRNALYKTLHDARARLRTHLTDAGYLPAQVRRYGAP
jgi:RNA polymerase sigma-70 factor (ECF subfamily)